MHTLLNYFFLPLCITQSFILTKRALRIRFTSSCLTNTFNMKYDIRNLSTRICIVYNKGNEEGQHQHGKGLWKQTGNN